MRRSGPKTELEFQLEQLVRLVDALRRHNDGRADRRSETRVVEASLVQEVATFRYRVETS
jgi:hypothetical protein